MFYKKTLNLFFIFSLFSFSFCFNFLSDYGFENFEKLNLYLTETGHYLDSVLLPYETDDGKHQYIDVALFYADFINKILSDLFALIKEDLSHKDYWDDSEVPEAVKFYINNTKNYLLGDDIGTDINYCYFAQKEIMQMESNFTVIGDLHGNYDAFSQIIKDLTNKKIISDKLELFDNEFLIFTGDFIDRGPNSLELLLFIFMLKILNPKNVFILKGNHENIYMAANNGFKYEVIKKLNIIDEFQKHLGTVVFEKICSIFNLLPEAFFLTVYQYNFMFAHGGWNDDFDIQNFIEKQNIKFIQTFYGITYNPAVLLSPFLWNDISPFIIEAKSTLSRGVEYPSNYVARKLFENGASALFCGHDHEKPKKVLSNIPRLETWDLYEKTDGFCELKPDSEYESPVYTTISGTIKYKKFDIAYKPSYARLSVKDDFWTVKGYSI